MKYDIVHKKDHYEVLIDGKFYCSADSVTEARKEILDHEQGK